MQFCRFAFGCTPAFGRMEPTLATMKPSRRWGTPLVAAYGSLRRLDCDPRVCSDSFGGGELQLLGAVFVEVGFEVGAATGFVEAGGSDDDQLLAGAETLGVDGGGAAGHA